MPVLGCRRYVKAVGPRQCSYGIVFSFQPSAEAVLAAFPLEQYPAVRLGKDVQPLCLERLVGRLKAVLMVHVIEKEVDFEVRASPETDRIKSEGMARNSAV